MKILGIHSGHDASLALVVDGKLVSSISVERYSRNKKDMLLSRKALDKFLFNNEIELDDIDCITMGYWNKGTSPWLDIYSPLHETYPLSRMGTYNKESMIMNHLESYENKVVETEFGYTLPYYLDRIQPPYSGSVITAGYSLNLNCVIEGYDRVIPGFFVDHHMSHAASTYYTSPFDQAAIMTVDASMHDPENCSGYYIGDGNTLSNFREPGLMIGTFYDAATEFLGLGPGTTKAGTLMGLAAFGKVSGKVKENAEDWVIHRYKIINIFLGYFLKSLVNIHTLVHYVKKWLKVEETHTFFKERIRQFIRKETITNKKLWIMQQVFNTYVRLQWLIILNNYIKKQQTLTRTIYV